MLFHPDVTKEAITTTIKHTIKHTIKLKTENKMLMKAATVVQVLNGLFYVLLQLFVVAAIILRFMF